MTLMDASAGGDRRGTAALRPPERIKRLSHEAEIDPAGWSCQVQERPPGRAAWLALQIDRLARKDIDFKWGTAGPIDLQSNFVASGLKAKHLRLSSGDVPDL